MIGSQIATQFHVEIAILSKNADFGIGLPTNFEDAPLAHF